MNIFREIFRGTNGDLSSKRIFAAILIFAGIALTFIGVHTPINALDTSIITVIGVFITSGLALLGVSVKEKKIKDYGKKDTDEEGNS